MKKSLLAKAESYRPKVDLSAIEAAAVEYRDLITRKAELEQQLSEAGKQVEQMAMVTLPDLLDTVGIDHIGVPAKGNRAAFDVVMKPFYKATIAAGWDDARKQAAFQALAKFKAGDLIRRTITIQIPPTRRDAKELEERLIAMCGNVGLEVEATKSVPWNSLTAWVKDRIESGKAMPSPDVIGATIGRKATIKERKS